MKSARPWATSNPTGMRVPVRPDNTGQNAPLLALVDQGSGPDTAEVGGSSPPRPTSPDSELSPAHFQGRVSPAGRHLTGA